MIFKLRLTLIGLLFILLNILPLSAQQALDTNKVTLAVMDFKNNSSIFGYDRLERTIPEILKTELSHSQEIIGLTVS